MKQIAKLLLLATLINPGSSKANHEMGLDEALIKARCRGDVQLIERIGKHRFYGVTCRGEKPRSLLVTCTDKGCAATPMHEEDEDGLRDMNRRWR